MDVQSKKNTFNVHALTEAAVMVALSVVLCFIIVYHAPFGGDVTLLSMAPIIILSLRRGCKIGLAAGLVFAVVMLIKDFGNTVAWVPDLGGKILCILLDYIIPFTFLGFGGMFRNVRFLKNERVNLIVVALLGTLAVSLFRFVCHVISGVVVWYALDLEWFADDPDHIVNRYSPLLFSILYNGSFMLPETIETCVGVPLLHLALKRIGFGEKGSKTGSNIN